MLLPPLEQLYRHFHQMVLTAFGHGYILADVRAATTQMMLVEAGEDSDNASEDETDAQPAAAAAGDTRAEGADGDAPIGSVADAADAIADAGAAGGGEAAAKRRLQMTLLLLQQMRPWWLQWTTKCGSRTKRSLGLIAGRG
jgi:hypothetical protein